MARSSHKQAALQAACDAFNAACPVGGRVRVTLDGGRVLDTVTFSRAQVLSGHSAVVWLRGVSGCYLLDRVQILPPPTTPSRAPSEARKG